MKFLLWLGIGVLLIMWLMRDKKAATRPRQPDAGERGSAEPMLQCTHCGIHIPASEAVRDPAGAVFCSDAHRLQHSSN